MRIWLMAARPRTLHALFDAGAGKADADVRALWDLAERVYPADVPELSSEDAERMRNERRLKALGIARQRTVPQPGEPAPEPFERPADVHALEARSGYGPPIEG